MPRNRSVVDVRPSALSCAASRNPCPMSEAKGGSGMKEVSEFLEAADAGRRLGMTSAGVVLHARTGRLRVAAVTPRGTRLFDPRVASCSAGASRRVSQP